MRIYIKSSIIKMVLCQIIKYIRFQIFICYFVAFNVSLLKYRYLAKTTSLDQLIPITYIVFLTKMQKGKPLKNDLPY